MTTLALQRSSLLPWLAYPCVLALSIAVYLVLVGAGVSAQMGSHVAGGLGALLVLLLEVAAPHRPEWRGGDDVRTDALYLVAVQMLLPLFLAVSVSAYALRGLAALGLEPAELWPHTWPIVAQAVLMLLCADFLRYWLHVASHRYTALWRLHAVHHSSDKLYWLNVGRFHPLEKTFQYLLDTLPFVLLGVGTDVVGLYLVFYAVNGFFQHSNVDLRLGLLNYLISGAELHRWHHSRVTAESNANYGNNLIVWDLVFGTRFLPRDRHVDALGLCNARYPRTFGQQLRAPLIREIDRSDATVPGWRELGLDLAIRLRMAWVGMTAWRRLRRAAQDPAGAQLARLRAIVTAHRDTEFGRAHGFARIHDFETFRARVPVQSYESLRPYIERQERTGAPALTAEAPIFYTQTSGTTGQPKFVPVLRSSQRDHGRCQALVVYRQHRIEPRAFTGRLLTIASPAVEGQLPGGAAFGSASGHIYRRMPRALRSRHVVPHEVFTITDYELKYLTIVRLALSARNVTYAAAANPSTFLKLLAVLREHRRALLEDVQSQGFHRLEALAPDVGDAIRPRLRCSAERVRELLPILAREDFELSELWPELWLLCTWTGGSCGIALEAVRRSLPARTRVVELGYLASELLGTVPVDPERGLGLPTLEHNLFEFVEKERWERQEAGFLRLDQLEQGREYYVFVTTYTGLYRYAMNDIVRVTGCFLGTPTLQFVQKGLGVTSITGEKLYEGQVIEAVRRTERALDTACPFFLMLADPHAARYMLLIEQAGSCARSADAIRAQIEQELAHLNVEYAQKRASGRLRPLEVGLLGAGTGDAYKQLCVSRGQRESQFKHLPLRYRDRIDFPYGAHVIGWSST